MRLYSSIGHEDYRPCDYLKARQARLEYFLADCVSSEEFEILLSQGWRKFSYFYFRPACYPCFECKPVRILAQEFEPSKSQRRLLRKNNHLQVAFGPLRYSKEVYAIYQDHSWNRFGKSTTEREFLQMYYQPSCPSLQSEYYLDDELIAVGFLDRSSLGLSSCYFIYKSSYARFGLGIYSVLAETQCAAFLNLKYYYLGYYIASNHHMAYKNRFYPHEIFDWRQRTWMRQEKIRCPIGTGLELREEQRRCVDDFL